MAVRSASSDYGLNSERLLWPTKGPGVFEQELGVDDLEQKLGLTTLEKAVALVADEVDVARPVRALVLRDGDDRDRRLALRHRALRDGGVPRLAAPGRPADRLRRVAHKMAAPLRQIYDQMLEPKWVIAMGACASSGGMFNNYSILQGVDKIVAVDIHVPGCPPRPEALMEGIIRLHEKVLAGVPPAYEIRGRGLLTYEGVPGLVETKEAYGETTLVVDPARLVEACLYLRDELDFRLPLRRRRDRLSRLGREGRRRLHRHGLGPRPERARLTRASRACRPRSRSASP